jgi:hypothetical protein
MSQSPESTMSRDELRAFAKAQIQEMERHLCRLQAESGYDPLKEKSLNEICTEWAQRHSAQFRQGWTTQQNLPTG